MSESSVTPLGILPRAVISLVTIFLCVELHELVHLGVGWMAGLPARFLHLTAVGVAPDVAAQANPAALAWMNGVAPVFTVVLGLLAFAMVASPRRRFRPPLHYALTWVAILGVPYAGFQLMLAAAPVRVRGDGADFAAVIGGYFQAPLAVRSIVAVSGVAVFVASGLWLGRLLVDPAVKPGRAPSLGARLSAVPLWRRLFAVAVGILSICAAVMSGALLFRSDLRGMGLLALSAFWGWPIFFTLLVPWRRPGPAAVWRHWIIPGLCMAFALTVVGLVFPSDYTTFGFLLLASLPAAAWSRTDVETGTREPAVPAEPPP